MSLTGDTEPSEQRGGAFSGSAHAPVNQVTFDRRELDRMHLVTLATNAGQVAQRSATTPGQQTFLRALDLPEPPKFFTFTLPDSR